MSDSLRVEIPGPACPQGSARAFVVNGKAQITSANKGLNAWRAIAVKYLQDGMTDRGRESPFEGPVAVWVFEDRVRPKGRAKRHVRPDTRPDLDKIARAALDVLVIAGVLKDDAQVCKLNAEKRYADKAGVVLFVEEI